MTRCSAHCKLLQHMRRVQQVHVLADACCVNELTLTQGYFIDLSTLPHASELYRLTDKAAEATRLILDAGRPATSHSSKYHVSWGNSQTLQRLKQAVYGPMSTTPSLSQLLYSASVEQTKSIKRWCVAMLSQSLTTSGAYFVILEAAVQAGVPPLREQALTEICSKFSRAVMTDSKGWTDLSQETVMLVLCSDKLQVDSEKEVLAALASWIEARPEERTCLFGAMFEQAVRMDELTYTEVLELDSHPLVKTYQKAYMLIAHALLAWHTGAHSPTASTSRHKGTRTGHPGVQRLAGQQPKVMNHQDLHSMQRVTDKHGLGSNEEESSQMQQPAPSSWQRGHDQQCWGASGNMSQQVHRDQLSQHDQISELSQQSGLHQMSSGPDAPQTASFSGFSGSDDQVQLSYSLIEGQSAELELQSLATSQLMGMSDGEESSLHADALLHQSSGLPRILEAPPKVNDDESPIPSAVRTAKALLMHVRTQCTTVQEDMAVSPSAVRRRKQARSNSARCLKF